MRRDILSFSVIFGLMFGFVGCDQSPQREPQTQSAPDQDTQPHRQIAIEDDGPHTIDTERPSAAHPIAGRTAFPAEGEAVTALIPAKRLSEEDLFAQPIDPKAIPELVPWAEAKQYVGYEITVVGTIVDVGQSRDGKVNFLNFHRDWRGKFYLVVFDDLAKTLPKPVDETFCGKALHVTGMVESHRGRPQIKILSMDQVGFVGG